MTDETTPPGAPGQESNGDAESPRPWWYGGAEGLPDMETILGPDGMEAVGGVAEEALKLFVVLRDRVGEAGAAGQAAAPGGQTGGWGAMLGQFAATAVKAVNDFAATAGQPQNPPPGDTTAHAESAPAAHTVAPGEAAACSYCPICQVIAVFRSVPMSTWQRLATSVVATADAARDAATSATTGPSVVITPEAPPHGAVLTDFLDGLEQPPHQP